jgi:multidrug efflux system membrane fusion protein
MTARKASTPPLLFRWKVILPVLLLAATGTYAFWPRPEGGPATGQPPGVGAAGGKAGGARPPALVVAAAAKAEDLAVRLEGLGSVEPLNTVTVRSRVDGQLMELLFQEGQTVKAGDPLASIDPRPFEVQRMQAEGQLARDQAFLKNAQLDHDRNRKLYETKDISKQELDTQEALVRQYEGAVKADQGLVESARLQLEYCRITAPIGGRVGLRHVDPGNLIRSGDAQGLVTIVQLQPIAVVFTIAEDDLPRVMDRLRSGERPPVEAWDRDLKRKLAEGTLSALDNRIDPGTGTVRLKAVFANEDERLFPSQFVNARLLVEVIPGAIVVPAAAIQRGPQGAFVYAVMEDRKVAVRPVTVGTIEGAQASIASGLQAGELVVVDGADRLRDGAPVELKSPGGPPGGEGAPGGARPPGGAKSAGGGGRKPGR